MNFHLSLLRLLPCFLRDSGCQIPLGFMQLRGIFLFLPQVSPRRRYASRYDPFREVAGSEILSKVEGGKEEVAIISCALWSLKHHVQARNRRG